MRVLLLGPVVLAGACRPAVQSRDTALPADTSSLNDTATEPPPDSGPDTGEPTEEVPGDTGPAPLPTLCTLSLACTGPIVDEPRVACTFRVEDGSGRVSYEGPAGVELRGRSSLAFPKPQYGVELWDETGEDRPVNLLGMGSEADWILNGAWVDRALLRNPFGFDLFQGLGDRERYAAETAYCTLTLDGAWVGIYHLGERVERDGARVDIPADPGDGSSFVLKLDESGGIVDNAAVGYGSWALVDPDPDTATAAQVQGVRRWMAGWQGAVLGGTPEDPETGIFAWVDLESAVDFVLLEELVKNNDAYFLSIHTWKEPDGRLHFVPWDLDLSLSQPTYNMNDLSSEWILYRPAFVDRMGDVSAFRERLVARWTELRAGPWTDDALLARMDGYRAVMGDDLYRNFEVWPFEDVDFYGYLPEVEDVDAEYARIRAWIPERTAWIDAHVAEW